MRASVGRTLATALALMSLVALAGCGADASSRTTEASETSGDAVSAPFEVSGEPVATDTVTLPKSYKFEPAVVTVTPGTSVTWTNEDNFPHNVKVFGATNETKDLPIGGTATIEFNEPGTVYYQCTLHPSQMKGKVIVEA